MVCPPDPALPIITAVTAALLDVFNPDQDCPPRGGGSVNVRFFAGDAPAMAAFDSHSNEGQNCGEPFVWLRAMRRYRTKAFPSPTLGTDCEMVRVLPVEIGVGRCAVTDQYPKWTDYQDEALTSLDDSRRIEGALCIASAMLRTDNRQVGTDTINPYGPEGGVIAWIGVLYASF